MFCVQGPGDQGPDVLERKGVPVASYELLHFMERRVCNVAYTIVFFFSLRPAHIMGLFLFSLSSPTEYTSLFAFVGGLVGALKALRLHEHLGLCI